MKRLKNKKERSILKKIICLLLSIAAMVSVAGCGGSEKEPDIKVTKGMPSYADSGVIERGAYCMPPKENYAYPDTVNGGLDSSKSNFKSHINEQEFRDYKDAGFTFMITEYSADWEQNEKFTDTSLYTTMQLAEKVGIPVIINTSPLVRYTGTNDFRISSDAKEYMQKMISTLSSYKMFKGFSFKDEPKVEYAQTFKAYQDHLLSLKPDLRFFVSYLPVYGSPDLNTTTNFDNTTENYIKYVDTYIEATGAFTYDYYPLRVDPAGKVNFILDGWYENLEIVAKSAKKHNNAPIGITIQSSSFGPPGKQNAVAHARTISTKEDVGFQIYSSLAYGVKEIGYFTYWQHWGAPDLQVETFYDAMVMAPEKSGEPGIKTDTYYAVQAMNKELDKFDHVIANFNWQGTMAVVPKGKVESPLLSKIGDYKNERIKSVSASEETIIGCLKDSKGFDGYMIVNSTEPSEKKTDKVTVSFYKASKALAYINGEEKTITLKDGSYTFDIGAGQGVFVIPIV